MFFVKLVGSTYDIVDDLHVPKGGLRLRVLIGYMLVHTLEGRARPTGQAIFRGLPVRGVKSTKSFFGRRKSVLNG